MSPRFLSVEDVLALHAMSLERFGGDTGIRDLGLVESAIAQPQASYEGQWLHDGLAEMAAAYLYSLVSNHAFVDGNKRIGVFAALQFLELNGYPIGGEYTRELTMLTLGVARGEVKKPVVVEALGRMAGLNET